MDDDSWIYSISPSDGEMPILLPVEDLPPMPKAEPKPPSPKIQNAQQVCKAGDTNRARLCIEQLRQAGTPPVFLQGCLQGAVELDSYEIVQMLLSAGVPINGSSIKPAFQYKALRSLSLFVEHGWDINEEEAWCIPPWLSLAIVTNPDSSLISWFLDHGADPNKACSFGSTPLSTAVAEAPLRVVKQLLKSCRSTTSFSGPLLHFAARRTDEEGIAVLQLVLDRCQPDLNAHMWYDTPLGYECYKMSGLGTALHEVARGGLPEIARILLERGTDVSIRDSLGNTALQVAETSGNQPVLEILRNSGAKEFKARETKI